MDEFISKLIVKALVNKNAENSAARAEAEKKDAEAIASVQALLPEELHQYVTILDGDTVLFAPECAPIQVTNARWRFDTETIVRHVVRRASQYGSVPTWSDEWCEAYLDLGEALYYANLEYHKMQRLIIAKWEAEQAKDAAKPNYLAWAQENANADRWMIAQTYAVMGILEYLQNRE